MAGLLAAYRASGRMFTGAGISSFVLDEGPRDAEPVICVHGVPASAYLYRKVVPGAAKALGDPAPAPLSCHLHPPTNDSQKPWTSSRGPATDRSRCVGIT